MNVEIGLVHKQPCQQLWHRQWQRGDQLRLSKLRAMSVLREFVYAPKSGVCQTRAIDLLFVRNERKN